MVKITVYIPAEVLEPVKTAMFDAGAGRLGNYEHCSWQVLGEGQFRPLPGSSPYVGQEGDVETAAEYRVEMVCEESKAKAVIAAMKQAHPYEVPAYDVLSIVDM